MTQIDLAPPREPDRYPYVADYQVRLADADAMGIVHHSRYLPYLEEARYDWIVELAEQNSTADLGLTAPVVEIYMRYLAPARPREMIRVHVRAAHSSSARIGLSYLVRRPADGATLLLGSTVNAFLHAGSGRPTRIPGWLLKALQRSAG